MVQKVYKICCLFLGKTESEQSIVINCEAHLTFSLTTVGTQSTKSLILRFSLHTLSIFWHLAHYKRCTTKQADQIQAFVVRAGSISEA